MAADEQLTIILPAELVRDIDRREKDRDKFVADAVRHELEYCRREDLERSLQHPHPESADLADQGLRAWFDSLPAEDTRALLDESAGRPIRWVPGEGLLEGAE